MSFRFRLYPSESHADIMRSHCVQARAIWNLALEHANLWKPRHSAFMPIVGMNKWGSLLTEARNEIPWLGEGSSSVQQVALRDLRQAFNRWWKNPSHIGRPTWRRKGINEGFAVRDLYVKVLNKRWATIHIPKCGHVRFRLTRFPALLKDFKSARINLDRAGRWHVSFSGSQPDFERKTTGRSTGLDLGVCQSVTTSDGRHLDIPNLLSPGEFQRLKRLQRKMARQKKGSNRRERTRLQYARLRAREADRRKDWIEKTTTQLVRDFDFIAIEDLKVKNMMKKGRGKRGLNRSIQNQSWGMFRRRLTDKASASTCEVVAVNPAYTSLCCKACGYTHPENRDSQAVFECKKCSHKDNADVNAARNILAAGFAVTGRGGLFYSDDPFIQEPDEALIQLPLPVGS